MIYKLTERIKDYKIQSKSKNSFLKKQLNDHNIELTTLKDKCKNMEESVNYLKGLIIN